MQASPCGLPIILLMIGHASFIPAGIAGGRCLQSGRVSSRAGQVAVFMQFTYGLRICHIVFRVGLFSIAS